jgi:ABC-type molybdenum transport system ATPase subunit/photorepair protein PhrA
MDVYIVTPCVYLVMDPEGSFSVGKTTLIMMLTTHLHPSIHKHGAVLRHRECGLSVTS